MLKLFVQFELGKIAKYFRTRTLAKSITGLLFMAVFLFVGSGIYFFFITGFRYINFEAVDDIREALTLFIYEMFLLVVSGIIIISAMISGLFNLFRGEYNSWILSSSTYNIFPKIVFIRSLLSSSIPSLIMFIPAVLAFTKIYNLGLITLFCLVLSLVLLLVTLNALTLLTIVSMASLYHALSKKISILQFNFGGLIIILFGSITILTALVWRMASKVDLVQLFKADELTDILRVEIISERFMFLPSHPLAMQIVSWQSGTPALALGYFLVLFVFASLSTLIWWHLSKLFYPLWQVFQERTKSIQKEADFLSAKKITYSFSGGKTLALFKKEALISSRNFKGVLWFLFLFLIWIAQVFTNMIISHNAQKYQLDLSQRTAIFESLQFIIAIYFMSSFVLRFVFPSFSMEKKTAWILKSAPISFHKIFFGKYLFYSSFFVGLGIFMSSITTNVLNLPLGNALYSTILFISTTICIVALGLSLGAIFPNTETDDPEAISTSMPGLFFTAIALMYGALGAFILYTSLLQATFVWLEVFLMVTIIVIILLLVKTPRLVLWRQNNKYT